MRKVRKERDEREGGRTETKRVNEVKEEKEGGRK